jgi:hypothetical protein
MRRGLAGNGIAILAPGETRAVLDAAAGSGVSCAEGQLECWQSVATLSGHDTVALLTADEVIFADPTGAKRAKRLVPGGDGIVMALQRALGVRGAVVIATDPAVAVVVVDGVAVAGGVADGLSIGTHVVEVSADGYASRREGIDVAGGDVLRVQWTLEPGAGVAGAAGGGEVLGPTLLYGGIGSVALGVVVAAGMSGVGWTAGECFIDPKEQNPLNCPEPKRALADTITLTGVAIGGAIAAVGAVAIVSSFYVE